jgi:hypothetical protein
MAEPRCPHFHEHFAWPRWIKLEFLDRERPALRIRRRQSAFAKDGSKGLHAPESSRFHFPREARVEGYLGALANRMDRGGTNTGCAGNKRVTHSPERDRDENKHL